MIKNSRSLLYLPLLFVMGLMLVLIAGCGQSTEVSYTSRTAEEAGVEVLDSSYCEGCHTSVDIISAYEKPKTEVDAGHGSGG